MTIIANQGSHLFCVWRGIWEGFWRKWHWNWDWRKSRLSRREGRMGTKGTIAAQAVRRKWAGWVWETKKGSLWLDLGVQRRGTGDGYHSLSNRVTHPVLAVSTATLLSLTNPPNWFPLLYPCAPPALSRTEPQGPVKEAKRVRSPSI